MIYKKVEKLSGHRVTKMPTMVKNWIILITEEREKLII